MNSLKIIIFISIIFACFLGIFKNKNKLIQGISAMVLVACLSVTIFMVLNTNRSVKYANSVRRIGIKAEKLKMLYEQYESLEKIPTAEMAQLEIDYFNDDWGKNVQKELTNESFKFQSFGRDGKEGGEGLDQDIIINWSKGDESLSVSAWDMKK